MSSVNRVTLIGRIGQEPEMKYMTSGNAVANISLATSESWKDKATGAKQEKTEWHRVVFFGKVAEIVGEYCKKGGLIYVEGKLTTEQWEDKEGVKRSTTKIIADQMRLLGPKSDGEAAESRPAQRLERPQNLPATRPEGMPKTPPASDDFDDIPF